MFPIKKVESNLIVNFDVKVREEKLSISITKSVLIVELDSGRSNAAFRLIHLHTNAIKHPFIFQVRLYLNEKLKEEGEGLVFCGVATTFDLSTLDLPAALTWQCPSARTSKEPASGIADVTAP